MNRLLPRGSSGSILLSSLWIVMILAVVSMGLLKQSVVESRMHQSIMDQEKARVQAWAGVQLARFRLSRDTPVAVDTIYQCGVRLPRDRSLSDFFEGPGEEKLHVGYWKEKRWMPGMSDEDGKLNVNLAIEPAITDLLLRIGAVGRYDEARDIALAIVDWRDADSENSGPVPAEDDYYFSLPAPYPCADRPLRVFEELLLVRGITPEILEAMRPYFTVYGTGAFLELNAHTASRNVLVSAARGFGVPEERAKAAAEKIIRYRSGRDREEGTADDKAFVPEEEQDGLMVYPWLDELVAESAAPAEMPALIRFRNCLNPVSYFFRVSSAGQTGNNVKVDMEAVFMKRNGKMPVLIAFHES